MIFIFSWNQLNEQHSVEPTKQHGFTRVDLIREVFSAEKPEAWPIDVAPTGNGYYVEYRSDGTATTDIPINHSWQIINQVLHNFTKVPVFRNPQALSE